jgi:hypothetical protein
MHLQRIILAMSLASFFGLAQARDFTAGEVWSYRARPGEEGSTLLINKVESDQKLGSIFHISISGVHVKNRQAASGETTELPHFPVSKETLEKSCVKLVGTAKPNQQYLEGYNEWKQAFDQGHAGVFTISVAEIIAVIETAVNK